MSSTSSGSEQTGDKLPINLEEAMANLEKASVQLECNKLQGADSKIVSDGKLDVNCLAEKTEEGILGSPSVGDKRTPEEHDANSSKMDSDGKLPVNCLSEKTEEGTLSSSSSREKRTPEENDTNMALASKMDSDGKPDNYCLAEKIEKGTLGSPSSRDESTPDENDPNMALASKMDSEDNPEGDWLAEKSDEGNQQSVSWLFEDFRNPLRKTLTTKAPMPFDIESDDDDDEMFYDDEYDDFDDDDDNDDYDDYVDFDNLSLEDLIRFNAAQSPSLGVIVHSAERIDPLYKDRELVIKDDKLKKLKRCQKIVSKLSDDQKSNTFCDVEIKIDGKIFPAHKSVLKALSSYFEAMFTGQFNESKQKCIELQSVAVEDFQIILDFAYGREVRMSIDNVFQVCMAAEMFCIDELVEECKKQLKRFWNLEEWSILNPVNFMQETSRILEISETLKMNNFSMRVIKGVITILQSLPNRKKLTLMLPTNILFPILLTSNKWNSVIEEEKLSFMMEWFRMNPSERVPSYKEVLNQLKLELIDPKEVDSFKTSIVNLFDKDLEGRGKEEFLIHLKTLQDSVLTKSLLLKFEICLFSQDSLSCAGDIRLYQEDENGFGSWTFKTIPLEIEVRHSVVVWPMKQLVLMNYDSFYIVDLKNLTLKTERKSIDAFRKFTTFIAAAQRSQIIIVGKLSFKKKKKPIITLNAFHYWKEKPTLIQLSNINCDYPPMAMSITFSTIYVLAFDMTKMSIGSLMVIRDRVSNLYPYLGLDNFGLNSGKYSLNRVILPYKENEKVFLIDQNGSMFGGLSMKLDLEIQDELALCTTRIAHELANRQGEWIGQVRGVLLASDLINSGNVLLIAQNNRMLLFHMETLEKFTVLKVLPKFGDSPILPDLNFPNTSVSLNTFTY